MPSLLYIGQNPSEGTGSPIVVRRHLSRFAAEGWEIRIVADYGADYSLSPGFDWKVILLPQRRVWWPPYKKKNRLLRWMRLRLLAYEIIASQASPPDVILSYLAAHTDFASAIAAHYARASGCPLHVLVHDDAASFPVSHVQAAALRRNQKLALAPAVAVWFVSEELANIYSIVPPSRRRILLPLPDGNAGIAKWHGGRIALKIYYAGHVWPQQVPLLTICANAIAAIGGQLVIIANPSSQLRDAASRFPIQIRPLFPTNSVALEFLREHATAVIVSYAEDVELMPWSSTSFPSKLIEYAHIGLPLALIAPTDTAVHRWAEREGFNSSFQPHEMPELSLWTSKLSDAAAWRTASAESLLLARGPADPTRIHGELERAFRKHAGPNPRNRASHNRISLE